MKNSTGVELQAVIDYLGEHEKQEGDYLIWQCPLCQDTGRDNLKYNLTKKCLWCFADDTHAPQILKDLYAQKQQKACNSQVQKSFSKIYTKEQQNEFKTYLKECNKDLLYTFHKSLKDLEDIRGIKSSTAEALKIGIDKKKCTWVIPTFEYTTGKERNIIGFEYRPLDFSKNGLQRQKGTPSGLAMINSYKPQTEILVIVEGYFDGYTLWQHLKEHKQEMFYHIVTPSNGINSLKKFIHNIEFNKYKRFCLFVDNDEAGNTAAEKIMEEYPMFERIILKCGCKDFNDHYLNCLKPSVENNS